jgi:hypothetical protein
MPHHDLPQRKHQRGANDEDEQRKDQVVKVHSLPIHVRQLLGNLLHPRPFAELANALHEPFSPNDPEHIKAPKGIDGDHTLT